MSDGRPALVAIDPEDCGCTDCLTGYSKPINLATHGELALLDYGELHNRSGMVVDRHTTFTYRPEGSPRP